MTTKRNHNSECVIKFRQIIDAFSYNQPVDDDKALPLWVADYFY